MTQEDFKTVRVFIYLMEVQAFANKALYEASNIKSNIDEDIWCLHKHTADVCDLYRKRVLKILGSTEAMETAIGGNESKPYPTPTHIDTLKED